MCIKNEVGIRCLRVTSHFVSCTGTIFQPRKHKTCIPAVCSTHRVFPANLYTKVQGKALANNTIRGHRPTSILLALIELFKSSQIDQVWVSSESLYMYNDTPR